MGWWFPVRPWQRGFFRDDITRIVAITEAVRDRWLGPRPFMPRERVRVVVPGVDPAVFHPGVDGSPVRLRLDIGPDAPLAGMIARFQHVKGHDVFQAMARRVLDQMRSALRGRGGKTSSACRRRSLQAEHLAGGAGRPGSRRGADLSRLLGRRARGDRGGGCHRLPVALRVAGMVHLESMAMARPVVSMNNGGRRRRWSRAKRATCPPDDPDALADRVVRLLRDPALRGRMGEAGGRACWRVHRAGLRRTDGGAVRRGDRERALTWTCC